MKGRLCVTKICHYDHLESIRGEWEEIYYTFGEHSTLYSFEFLLLRYNYLKKNGDVRLYWVTCDDVTVGFFPLIYKEDGIFRKISSLSFDHCMHSSPLVRKGFEGKFFQAVLSQLVKDKDWDVLEYNFTYSFDRFPCIFTDDLLNSTRFFWRRHVRPNWSVIITKSFEDYLMKDLSRNIRKNIRKSERQLAKNNNIILKRYEGLCAREKWPVFLGLEDSGWKGVAGSSIRKAGDVLNDYYQPFVELLDLQNNLYLYFLELDGEPIAGGFGYVQNDTFHYAKMAYDEKYKLYSPGILLLLYLLKDLKSSRNTVARVNMFPWDYGYKHRLANEETTSTDTIIFNLTFRGQSIRLYRELRSHGKNLLLRLKALRCE